MLRVSLILTGSSQSGFYREAEAGLKASTKESWGVIWATKGISLMDDYAHEKKGKSVYIMYA